MGWHRTARWLSRVGVQMMRGRTTVTVTGGDPAEGTRRPRVVYWNNIPAPYMVDRFNAVADRGKIDIVAWFGERDRPGRSWEIDESTWRFPYRYLPRIGLSKFKLTLPTAVISHPRPDLLVSLYATPSFLAGQYLARARGWHTALWVEVTFDTYVRRRAWKEAVKRDLFQRVDGIITSGSEGAAFAARYGALQADTYVARHTADTQHFITSTSRLRSNRDLIRKEFDVHGIVFLYVGRLLGFKGVFQLLEAYALVERALPGRTSLLIAGDGPEESALRIRAQGLNVHFAGYLQQAELPKAYAASDIFVFPSQVDTYGLVIDEAMASGLPIVSTSSVGELSSRVITGQNGFQSPGGDVNAMAESMIRLAEDGNLRDGMGSTSRAMIAPHTPTTWAADFESAVASILARPEVSR